jgi:DNA-binding IclR family transcriptional regulator
MAMIQSVDRALEILIYLYKADKEMGITQIAQDLGIYKSTVYRTLLTMENRGFISKNPETDKYWLGNRFFTMGKSVEKKIGIQDIIKPYAKALRDEFNVVVNVSILERDNGEQYRSVIIVKESANSILTLSPEIGSHSLCHCSSVGKCLLAFSEDIDLSLYDEGMQRYTENTLITRQQLEDELKKVRANGYAIEKEEQEEGLACIGAPILGQNGYAVAAISMSGSVNKILDEDKYRKIEELKKTARMISDKL